MIKQVSHTVAGTDPAGFALALEVAYELHAPETTRAPEVAAAHGAGRRAVAARSRRRTVRG
ncbi:hypothetical protein ADK57_41375 [Streptomyces sp. MMG1533]|uniref:hypothetical protein n=1 Tax=Streptomyces sp. MMG1533 TaxID=1415546 RepID=UPI0006AE5763|nr:hypothetical protein [Streptomyces sp. MMG1533]KOU56734.1 hypothetical protein ADK57_41375 [Streptomyces sp. MMG1533]